MKNEILQLSYYYNNLINSEMIINNIFNIKVDYKIISLSKRFRYIFKSKSKKSIFKLEKLLKSLNLNYKIYKFKKINKNYSLEIILK